ncbi:MAG: GntR family transcriptional regulator, transcriptional repressor for pyruvate dehydrogenase complex [Solirubrobacteraceae bacterium]|nr:GntR family transcriptional regulator, transcriptional repressor for pyruvate dehydrogenase complex [Solirubrobacteraceae bacterium]
MLDLEPIARQTVSEAVYERLLADVLTGRLAAGDPLPGERALSEAFEVNRHAVREAIKRLQQAGLVIVAQGGATRVVDWRRSAGLDVLVSLATVARGDGLHALVKDIAEMRAALGADVARACAQRSPDADPAPVDLYQDPADRAEAYDAFWDTITDGAQNLAYRLALNTLVAAQRNGAIDPQIYEAERDDPAAQRGLADAIASGDAEQAHARALALLNRTVEQLK